MTDSVSTTGRIQVTLEIDWPHSFGENATAKDICTTVAKECRNALESSLIANKVSYRIIGEIKPIMVVYPTTK
jgi:hypothetical protein